jgi:membrane-bound ClpP family serine protease
VWLTGLMSRICCAGPLLALTLLCMSIGVLFAIFSFTTPGIVYISVAILAQGFCMLLGQSRYQVVLTRVSRTS